MSTEYVCGWCLEVTEAEDYPLVCPKCNVTSCDKCSTFLKPQDIWCHGCKAEPPNHNTPFSRAGSIVSAYAGRGWQKRSLGHGLTDVWEKWMIVRNDGTTETRWESWPVRQSSD